MGPTLSIAEADVPASPFVWGGPADDLGDAWADEPAALQRRPLDGVAVSPTARLQQQLLEGLADSPDAMIGLAVALPFCAVHCLCCDRDVRAGQPAAAVQGYVEHLCHEITLLAGRIGTGHELMRLHLGGGSANLLEPHSLALLMHTLRRHWRMPSNAELSAECDPRRAGWGIFELLRGMGVQELRFGVLDLAPAVQRAIGRLQSAALVDDACGCARAAGFERVHLELMAGLPRQTPDSWQCTLQQVVAMAPARITVRRYRHRPWLAPGQCAIDAEALPDAGMVHALLLQGARTLGAVGYRWIGAELFVLDDDPLSLAADAGHLGTDLHGHTAQPALPLLGVGRGAVSDLAGSLLWNLAQPAAWQADVAGGRLPLAQGWRADRAARRRRAAAAHLLCHQELPAGLLVDRRADLPAEVPDDLFAALARRVPAGSLRRLPGRLLVGAEGRSHLPALCAAVAGLPTDLPATLPPWLG